VPNQPSVERRLAAILAADVVGYSRLMGADEVGTLVALRAIQRELVDPAIASHHGRAVKTTGDGFLIEFASVVAAVSSAIAIQRGMVRRNSNTPEQRRVVFRIGINVGDIIIEQGDIFGDGVNIAARLEALCEPGGLCISRTANDQIRDKLSLAFADLGEQPLKNIARAVGIYHLAANDIAALPEDTITVPGAADEAAIDGRSRRSPPALAVDHSAGERGARPTLAVLPFDNLSRAAEVEGFCDGLVEDAITALSKFRWLNVVARNSSFAKKGHAADIRQVARDLNVRYVLEGSVRKSGGRIRITAQLIEGTSGNHVWAERYDRDYSDLFDLQDEITRDIVASLEYVLWIALTRANSEAGAPDPEVSPLRAAGWHIVECTHPGNLAALSYATSALKTNPKSVAACQYLANAYIAELFLGWTEDAEADLQNLLEAGRRATALSPADSLSQGLHGCALGFAEEHDEALSCVRRALALNTNSVNVLGPCGNALSFSGEAPEANEMLERMLRLAPAHYFRAGFLSQMALNCSRLGEHERGLPLVSEALKLKPEALCCHIIHAGILKALGRSEAASAAISKAYQRRPDLNRALIGAMFPHRDRSVADGLAETLGLA
jgi:adenylate cyclase